MRRVVRLVVLTLLLTSGMPAVLQAESKKEDQTLVDSYGLLPQFRAFSISPDGKHYAYIQRQEQKDYFVVMNPAQGKIVASVDADKFKARDLYFATNNYVIILASETKRQFGVRGKWENSTAIAYNLKTKQMKTLLQKTKSLYPAQGGLGRIVGFNKNTDEVFMPAYSGSGGAEPRLDLYRVSLKTGVGKIHTKGRITTRNWFVNSNGQVLAREDFSGRKQQHVVYAKHKKQWKLIYSADAAMPEITLTAVTPDEQHLLFVSGDENYSALYSMSLDDGQISEPLYQREKSEIDRTMVDINRQLIGIKFDGFKPSYGFPDQADNQIADALVNHYPASAVHYVGKTADSEKWLIRVSGNAGTGDYKLYNKSNNQLKHIISEYPQIKSIGEIKAISFKARDGVKIPSILTLPREVVKPTNLPLILLPHGGPRHHDTMDFNWLSQFFSAKGYAVMQPNFRGSTGFGFELRDRGNAQWGLGMQDDVSDSVKVLVNAGYVDPDRVCIIGASYGGYSALAGGAFTPDLYRCVISIAGISDIPAMMKSERREAGLSNWRTHYWEEVIGDPDKHEARLESTSPVNFASDFKAPVLLLHGKDDTVVSIRQSKEMHNALQSAGKDSEFVQLESEDHWLSTSETRLALLHAINDFLDEHNPAGQL